MTEDRHLDHWLRALRSAERELDEARLCSDLNRLPAGSWMRSGSSRGSGWTGGRICSAMP